MRRHDVLAPDGARLAVWDFGGDGPPVLLIPGLCGYAGEWTATAAWLTGSYHVYGIDPRGHGDSERRPRDVSRAAHVADVVTVLRHSGPAVVIGQSLGGHTAFMTAVRHPELVESLVMVEAGAQGPDEDDAYRVDRWLASWPIPFSDPGTASAFFGGGPAGRAWARGLRQRDDGWYPSFDRDVMVATIAAAVGERWSEFDAITCPTLVVRGGVGSLALGEYYRMSRHPLVVTEEVPEGGHDLHLDSPDEWREVLASFLNGKGGPAPGRTA